MTLIQWVIIICTAINIGGIFVSRHLGKQIEKKKRAIQIFGKEIEKSLNTMEKLSKKLRKGIRLSTPNNFHQHMGQLNIHIIEDEELLLNDRDEDAHIKLSVPKWEEISEKGHKDLANIMSKKKRKGK